MCKLVEIGKTVSESLKLQPQHIFLLVRIFIVLRGIWEYVSYEFQIERCGEDIDLHSLEVA